MCWQAAQWERGGRLQELLDKNMARLDLPGSKSSSCILKPKWQQALPGWVFSIMSFHDVYFETNAFSNFHKGLVCLFKFSPLCQGVSTSLKGRCRWFCRRSCFLKVYVYIIWTAITFPIKIENIYVASWFCCGLVWKFLLCLLYQVPRTFALFMVSSISLQGREQGTGWGLSC